MTPHRVIAVALFVIALLGLAATNTFPFLDDLSELAETAVAFLAAGCAMLGVWLWFRKPDAES